MTQTHGKRERLISAAAQLFWVQGYPTTSLADIAEAADVSLGNVYYYFKTKAAFARAVAGLFVTDMTAELEAIDRHTDTGKKRLQALLSLLARGNDLRVQHGCPIAGAIRDFTLVDKEAAKKAAETFVILETWMATQLTAPGHGPDSAKALAEEIVIAWQGAIVLAHGEGSSERLEAAFKRISERIGLTAIQSDIT